MDNDKDKKIIKSPYYSLEKLSEDSNLVKRGLRDLGILPKIQTLLHEISIQFHDHNYQKCIDLCDEVLVTEPNTLLFLCYKALSLQELGQPEDALIWFDKTLSIDPEFTVALCNKADILRTLGRYEEAVTLYDKIFIKEPDMMVHLVGNKGDALYNLGRYEDASIFYNQVLSIEPNNAVALIGIVNMGMSLDNLGRHEEAIIMYDKVLIRANDLINNDVLFELSRSNTLHTLNAENFLKTVFWNKSLSLADIGRYEEAIIVIDKVLDIDSTDKESYFNKGALLHKLERFQEAIEMFDKALEIDPQYEDAINGKKIALSVLIKTKSEKDVGRQKFYVVPQTEEEIEENRKKIEELRAKGLLQGHEKTFKIQKDGTIVEEE